MVETQELNFDSVACAVANSQIFSGASFAHGWLSGMVCAGKKLNGTSWVELLLGLANRKDQQATHNRQLLLDLYHSTCEQLHNFSFDFQMLLPNDEVLLKDRAVALSQWCGGYLEGLDLAGIGLGSDQLRECQEALHDFVEIANLDYENIMASNEDENSYMQVVEYVRMAVLLVYTVMTAKQNKARGMVATDKYLH